MKKTEILYGIFLGLVLPWLVLSIAVLCRREASPAEQEEPQGTSPVRLTALVRDDQGTVTEMDMDEYLTGAVLGEMPAYFETEALKAQAVAARTFTMKAQATGGKHGDGSVCTDSTCCQAYSLESDYLARGGSAEDVEKIRRAVADTSCYVLTYGGELIDAVYFSCSGGRTEDAVAVWGRDVPYLRATDSPGEENAAHYTDSVTFEREALEKALGQELMGSPSQWLGAVTYTSGGGIAQMEIGEKTYSGTELRKLLGLRSTAFTVTPEGEGVRIDTRGYGHRVGLSQYGADAMAASGKDYREILSYYYSGTALEIWR